MPGNKSNTSMNDRLKASMSSTASKIGKQLAKLDPKNMKDLD
jgi:hypothetical protein